MSLASLPSPHEIKTLYPAPSSSASNAISFFRSTIQSLLFAPEKKILILGPCSISDPDSFLKYAKEFKALQKEVENTFFPILRAHIEKPRTQTGWKGLLYQPNLFQPDNIAQGLVVSRKLLVEIANMEIPLALEIVNPLMAPYFDDLISWGCIGARTCSSQIHREYCSSALFPMGFKNSIDGNFETAIDSMLASQVPHRFLGINHKGSLCEVHSKGNPFTCLILRGSIHETNYDDPTIFRAHTLLKRSFLPSFPLVDCSHGNSKKSLSKQKEIFLHLIKKCENSKYPLLGMMLESYLRSGSQKIDKDWDPEISITDPCLSIEDTKELILNAHDFLTHSLSRA